MSEENVKIEEDIEKEEDSEDIKKEKDEKLKNEETETKMTAESDKKNKQIKNLISVAILLAGLLIGSLFVDVAQIVRGNGYSQKNLDKSDIFEAEGKTWVAYNEPAVGIKVISDDKCDKCDPSEVLVWFRRMIPTVSAQKIDYNSHQGKQLISQFNIKTLPAFIFDQDINKTDFYIQAKKLFKPKNNEFILDAQKLGLPAGKYLQLPQIKKDDATLGKADSKVKVIIFSDFQCPYCKLFYTTLRDMMKTYQDKVLFVFKELPLDSIHPQASNAALASECALEQNKFWQYADNLYAKQSKWSSATGTTQFKKYAQTLGLNTHQFNQCLDSKKYQGKIDADKKEASDFSISGTPAIFVNDQFKNGVISKDQLKKAIDEQLNKK